MKFNVRLIAFLLALGMAFLCGCEGEAVSSNPALSSEPSAVASSTEPALSSEPLASVVSSESAETSKETSSKKPVSTSTSSKKPSQQPAENNENVNIYGNSQGNLNGGGWAAVQGDWIYYSTFDALYKMKSDGSQNQKIFDDTVGKINVVGDWIYFNRNGNDISRMKINGSEYKVILKNVSFFTVVNHKIYYTDSETGYLYRVDENGANKALLIEEDCKYDINVTEDAICWGAENGTLCIADINGKNIKRISEFYPQEIIICDGVIYEAPNLKLSNAETGKEITQYLRKTGGAGNINISDGWIYFSYWEDKDRIYKMKTDGTQMQKLSDLSATSITVVGQWIFYLKMEYYDDSDGIIHGNSSDLYRMRIDGSDNQMISKWDWKYLYS